MEVIDIDQHRVDPNTVWWEGRVRCASCDHEHIAVVPIPAWAASPPALECAGCHEMACLPVAEGQ